MNVYHVKGLKNAEQAKRIECRFQDALNKEENVRIDFKNNQIHLPDSIDSRTITLISSFEQISILLLEEAQKILSKEEDVIEHEHSHSHDHHGIGEGETAERNILIVFFLNLFFAITEFFFGSLFNSQAILSDAVHDLGDAVSIGLAFLFERISNRSASSVYSYGYRRFSLLGAFVTSVLLIIGAILVTLHTIPELLDPQPINQVGVFWVAIAAIIINGFSVWLMSRGDSANEKLLNIHLFEDLFGWVAVLVMSIILNYTNWYILDPLLSIGIALWILYMTIPEFLRISKIFLQAVPDNINVKNLRKKIQETDNVRALSHFHIWSTDGKQHMMTLTVTTDSNSDSEQDKIKQTIRKIVMEYDISHITIELLYDPKRLINQSISCEE